MANPRAVPDDRGEWMELHSLQQRAVDLRGWTFASKNDRGVTIERSVVILPGGFASARAERRPAANGGVTAAYACARRTDARERRGLGRASLGRRIHGGLRRMDLEHRGASRALSDTNRRAGRRHGPRLDHIHHAYGNGDLGTPGSPNAATDR